MRSLALAVLVAIAAPAAAVAAPADTIKLAQAKVDAAAKVFATAQARWQAGSGTFDEVAAWSTRWLNAQRDQGAKGAKLKAALTAHRDRMQAAVTAATERVKSGVAPVIEVDEATYYLAEAELWLARGK